MAECRRKDRCLLLLFLLSSYTLTAWYHGERRGGWDGLLCSSIWQCLCWPHGGRLALAEVFMICFSDFYIFFFSDRCFNVNSSDFLELLWRAECPLNNCLMNSLWIVRDIAISIATNGLSKRSLYFWNRCGTRKSHSDQEWEQEYSTQPVPAAQPSPVEQSTELELLLPHLRSAAFCPFGCWEQGICPVLNWSGCIASPFWLPFVRQMSFVIWQGTQLILGLTLTTVECPKYLLSVVRRTSK